MELKKSPQVDLEKRRPAYLLIGIMMALCLPIALFSWSKNEKTLEAVEAAATPDNFDTPPLVIIDEPKPEEVVVKIPIVTSDILNLRPNDDPRITTNIDILGPDVDISTIVLKKDFTKKPEEPIIDDTPDLRADEMPSFNSKVDDEALDEFRKWVMSGLQYPESLRDLGIQGTVHLKFIVERDGTISDVQIVRGVNKELDNLAVNRIKMSPKWIPGKNKGRPVRIVFSLPIKFKLQ